MNNFINKKIALWILSFLTIGVLVSFSNLNKKEAIVEKIYTHTDRSFYFPDETIWFKSYITQANNTISSLNDVMYAELISPKGSVVKTLKLSVTNGYAYGDFKINEDWVGGIYSIKTYTNWMKNYGEQSFYTKKIIVQKIVQPNLLMKVNFQEKAYGPSSKVTLKLEVKDLKNVPLKNHKIDYIVSVKGKKYLKKSITLDESGKKDIGFSLPAKLNNSDVVCNIRIPYKGSTESISRSVPIVLNNIDLQFFPESGKTLANTNNNIAFKAVTEFGKPADVAGDIVDKNGTLVTSFKSFHDGMGSFSFLPENKTYFAKITHPFVSKRQITLPKVHQNGVKFTYKNDSLFIYSAQRKKVTLELGSEQKKHFQKTIQLKKGLVKVPLNTIKYPIGIFKISLKENQNHILCERLVFINNHKQLNIAIKTNKIKYQTREKVSVSIKTTDANNKPIPANLSIAIADNKIIAFADDKQDNILSYLLMSSELKGKIHEPSFYFDSKEEKATKALELVMLTHGWRSYITDPVTNIALAKHKPELKSIQNGLVTDRSGNPIKAKLLLFDNITKKSLVFETDNEGKIAFKIENGNQYTLLAYREDGKTVKVIKTDFSYNSIAKNTPTTNKKSKEKIKAFNGFKKPNSKKEVIDQKVSPGASLSLDNSLEEVVVTALGIKRRNQITSNVSVVKAEDITKSSNITQALAGKVSGLQITNNNGLANPNTKIILRGVSSISGTNQALIVVDGVPVSFNNLNNINPNNIENVSVLKGGAGAAIYGSRGGNGVIIVSTKQSNYWNTYKAKKINNRKYKNYTVEPFYYSANSHQYYNSKKFYIPIYESKELPEERTDFRQTIYWNPIIETDSNGEASFEFYNSDAVTSFKITAEGVGYNGLVGRQEKDYAAKKMLNIDAKLPAYLTVDDEVILPVVISNDSNQGFIGDIEIQLPNCLELVEKFNSKVNIKANGFLIKNIKLKPIKNAQNSQLKLAIKTTNYKDEIQKKVSIINPYFPTQATIAGSKNESYVFNVNDVVPNTLEAQFNIYTDIVGDVMNGIEGIIREPYGCFEQVSSSTYPNILVLKYLKETGKNNLDIEQKALKFIKKGYKKLAAYETAEDGFEWYGATPPHEALSAYGLMEFTEMKEVYNGVDEKMLQRTVNWLLNRRNGKGGFKQNRGKYGFSGAPENVNNAYIVYALAASGINTDVEKEYNATYQEALKSNDLYRVSLLALASHHLNKTNQFNTLINKIKEQINHKGFNKLESENTITRSYGESNNIETTAFILLALMKETITNEVLLSKGIEHLISKRKYGRFGSTQATCMSLKALIEYTKFQKEKLLTNNSIVLTINGKKLIKKLEKNNQGTIVINDITQYITEGTQKISVAFSEVKNNFPYELIVKWNSTVPDSSKNCKVAINTQINKTTNFKVGDLVRFTATVTNKKATGIPMVTAIIGTPSGATTQPWQLKELVESKQVAYYEIFDNYLVLYWRELGPNEVKTINLDLKAEIAGSYQAPASCVYLYYTDENKHWVAGNQLNIHP